MNIQAAIEQAFQTMIEQGVREVIAGKVGSGIHTEVKQVIMEQARLMFEKDDDIRKVLKDTIIHWVKAQ